MAHLTVLSFGGGQDSTAILYKLIFDPRFRETYAPQDLVVLFSDTRDEHPETYQHLDYIRELCHEHDIEFAWIKGHKTGAWGDGLRGWMQTMRGLMSKAFPKSCTDQLKIRPIYRYLETWLERSYGLQPRPQKRIYYDFLHRYGKIRVILGIAAGEESRISGSSPHKWMNECLEKVYPLVELSMDRSACQRYIREIDQPLPPPSNCMLCPFMSEIELLWLYRFYPADYNDWVELEKEKLNHWAALGDRNVGVWGKPGLNLPQVLARAQQRYGNLSDVQLQDYKMSHGHCVKSKF